MKKIKFIQLAIFIVLMATLESYSQSNFRIHLGASNPLSDFASDDPNSEEAGGAALGFNVGLKYTHQLSDNGLGFFVGLDFNQNGLKQELKDDVKSIFEDAGVINADITYYKHRNIPLSAGLNYSYSANESIDLFCNAGLTFNMLLTTDMIMEANGMKVTTEVEPTNSIGFRVGGGILISERVSIAIDYLGLGNHDMNGEMKAAGMVSEEFDGELKVDILTMTLGLNF